MSPAEKQKSAPADLSEEYGAPFTIISHDEGFRYNSLLRSRDFTPPRSLDFDLIETLGWTKAIDSYCRTLNMEKFVKMKHDAFQQLMLEFYTTLSFDDGDGFQCRLMGKSVTVTRKTLCDIFGFREGGHRAARKNFDPVGFWREISGGCGGDFKNGRPPSSLIKHPILLHMYKYISHGVFGRVDSSKVRMKDLFYLWCVFRHVRVCTPSFLVRTFKSVLRNKRANMCLGNLITAIAVYFGAFDPLNTDMTVLPMRALGNEVEEGGTVETSCSDGEDTNPVAINDLPQPAVDTWRLISRNGEDTNAESIDDQPQPAGMSNTSPDFETWLLMSRNGEDTNPATIDDQPEEMSTTPPAVDTNPVTIDDIQAAGLSTTTPPTVDTWMLITRILEKMQTQINGGFNIMETRFDGLEKKVNAMHASFQSTEQESNGTNAVEELKQENFEAKKTIEKLRVEKLESDKAAAIYKTRLEKLLPSVKMIEEGLSDISSMKAVDLASSENDMRDLGTFEEGGDLGFQGSRGKTDSLTNGSMPVVDAEDVAVLLPDERLASNSNGSIGKGLSKNGDENIPQPWTRKDDIARTVNNSPGSQSGHNPPPPGSNECMEPLGSVAHASGTRLISEEGRFCKTTSSSSVAAGDIIIEVLDSDDEINPSRAAQTSKRVLGSDVGENQLNFLQKTKRNRTDRMGNLFAFPNSEGKKDVRTVEDNVLIHDKGNEVIKSSHDNVECSPSGGYVEEALESQNCLNDGDFEDSEDETLSDSKIEDLIASLRRENCVRKFMYEADMLRAFLQDEELCLNAVCALYRQTLASTKSNGRLTLSKNGGFSPFDSTSGCALAEYLIDGDKELRLTKSVSQVEIQRPGVVTQCKRLAIIYVEKLFAIYCDGGDPLFCQP